MTLIENSNKKERPLNEFMDIKFDKLRKVGGLVGWQQQFYRYITVTLGNTILPKLTKLIANKVESMRALETVDPEDVKKIIKLALIDYIDSSM